MTLCPVCVAHVADLGEPSNARWVGPDGEPYCSIHLTRKFGHKEPLVPIANYVPPAKIKPPAKKKKEASSGVRIQGD